MSVIFSKLRKRLFYVSEHKLGKGGNEEEDVTAQGHFLSREEQAYRSHAIFGKEAQRFTVILRVN